MPHVLRLAVVGTAAGAFSGLFGVGGGALFVPALASGGALGGVALANALPERALEVAFAMLQLFVAAQLARRSLRTTRREEP